MPSFEEPLVELPVEDWSKLKAVLQDSWPYGLYIHNMLETQEKWQNSGRKVVKIYVPFGNVNFGMIAIFKTLLFGGFLYTITIFSIDNDLRLAEALVRTKIIDWSRNAGIMVSGLNEVFKEKFLQVLNVLNMKVLHEYYLEAIYKKKEVILKDTFKCPDEIYVTPLSLEHASSMNFTWPHKFPGSVEFFETMIEQNGGFGLLTKSEHELIAWVSQNEFGGLCHLYCVEEHRRKGYAWILTKCQEHRIAQSGHDTHAFVVADNVVSKGFFDKLSYKTYNKVYWLHIKKQDLLTDN